MPKSRSRPGAPGPLRVGAIVLGMLLACERPGPAEAVQDSKAIALDAGTMTADSASSGIRTWTDATERFKTDAEFVELKDGNVRLRKATGAVVTVPLEKLCDADRAYIASMGSGASKPSRTPLADAAPNTQSRPDSRPSQRLPDLSKGPPLSEAPKLHSPEEPSRAPTIAPQLEPSKPPSVDGASPTLKTHQPTTIPASAVAPAASTKGAVGMPGWAWGLMLLLPVAVAIGVYGATVVRKRGRLTARSSRPATERQSREPSSGGPEAIEKCPKCRGKLAFVLAQGDMGVFHCPACDARSGSKTAIVLRKSSGDWR